MLNLSESPNGILPVVPGLPSIDPPAVIERITDPRILSGLLYDGEWRCAAEWPEARLYLRRCGEEAALEARLVLIGRRSSSRPSW